ncbi:MAG: BTAD domain-containing putative transcriptional regulator [Gaiellaceae bacterium]
MLEFRVLGPVEVWDDERALQLGGPKQRALLALLLLDAGRVVSTDRLIDVLWGEHPPATAATSLQNLVSQLRKLLGADVLVTKPPGYRLEIQAEQLDLERFRRLVEGARQAPPAERSSKLREAVALWRGAPLADLVYEDFAQNEVARLEELKLVALEQLFEADLEVGRDAELVSELEALVAEHPLREGFRRHLMLALYRSGRQAEALQVYHDGRRELVDQLGIEPSAALQQLHGAILRHDPQLEVNGARRDRSLDPITEVVETMLSGRLVPVLGADVAELAAHLSERFEYPDDSPELPRIAQYVAVMRGAGPLHDELHALLHADVPPTQVHRFFASLPPLLRERGAPHQLIVTTSYDLALERAFLDAGEEFDVVSYIATGRNRGRFCHLDTEGRGTLIERPNEYATELSLERRTVILKLHGQVDPTNDRAWESFVVTEDDYIGYLAHSEVGNVVPVSLAAKLRRSHFLFLGYTMADWNLRLLLYRLWGDQPLSYRSWAVQEEPRPFELEFWRRHDVNVIDVGLEEYVEALARHVGVEPAGVAG